MPYNRGYPADENGFSEAFKGSEWDDFDGPADSDTADKKTGKYSGPYDGNYGGSSGGSYGGYAPKYSKPFPAFPSILADGYDYAFRSERPGYPGGKSTYYVEPSNLTRFIRQCKEQKIGTIILLLTDLEQYDYYGVNLARYYHGQGIRTVCLPIKDHGDLLPETYASLLHTLSALGQGYAFSEELMATGRVIGPAAFPEDNPNFLVHCSAGIGRTGMVLGCCEVVFGPPDNDPNTSAQSTGQLTSIVHFAKYAFKTENRSWLLPQSLQAIMRGMAYGGGRGWHMPSDPMKSKSSKK